MTQPGQPLAVDLMQVPVNPLKVISVLKQRLTEEIGQTAMLTAMLQEAQERERGLIVQLNEARQTKEGPG